MYELLCDWTECIRNIEPPQDRDTELNDKEQADYLNNASRILKQKYDMAYPLIEENLRDNMEQLINKLFDSQSNCYVWIVSDDAPQYRKVDYDGVLKVYHECYLMAKEQFERIIYIQLQKLLLM